MGWKKTLLISGLASAAVFTAGIILGDRTGYDAGYEQGAHDAIKVISAQCVQYMDNAYQLGKLEAAKACPSPNIPEERTIPEQSPFRVQKDQLVYDSLLGMEQQSTLYGKFGKEELEIKFFTNEDDLVGIEAKVGGNTGVITNKGVLCPKEYNSKDKPYF